MQVVDDEPISKTEQQLRMRQSEERRVAFRRRAYMLKHETEMLADELETFSEDACEKLQQARLTLFEAWTALCVPPDEPDDMD